MASTPSPFLPLFDVLPMKLRVRDAVSNACARRDDPPLLEPPSKVELVTMIVIDVLLWFCVPMTRA